MEAAGCRGSGEGDGKADSQFLEVAKNFFPFSENNMSRTHKTKFQLELPVKYAIYMIVTRCCSTPCSHQDGHRQLCLCVYTLPYVVGIYMCLCGGMVCVCVCVCVCVRVRTSKPTLSVSDSHCP